MSKITEAELAGLSDEERAALEDEDAAPGANGEDPGSVAAENDAGAADAGAEPVAEGAAAPEQVPAEGGADQGNADGAPGASDNDAAGAADEDKDEDADEDAFFVPRYTAQPVLGYAEKIAALDEQFDSGEISLKEYANQRDALVAARIKAEISAEQEAQIAMQRWEWEVDRFIRDVAKNEGIDYNKPILNAALDTAVKALANQKDANGNLVNQDKKGEWFLAEAHRQVQAELGLKPAASAAARKQASQPRNVPVTLSQLPAAQEPASPGEEDSFAYIDKLFAQGKVEEGEMALAKLSKAEERKYLEGR